MSLDIRQEWNEYRCQYGATERLVIRHDSADPSDFRAKYASLTRYLSGLKQNRSHFLQMLNVKGDENVLVSLEKILEKERFKVQSFIVEILAEINTTDSLNILRDYAPKADAHTRSRIIGTMAKLKRAEYKELYSSFLTDEDHRVVADSVLALGALGDEETNEGLMAFIRHPTRRVKANAIVALWPTVGNKQREELLAV